MTPEQFRGMALALPEAAEGAHMGRADFRVRNKIFATLTPELDLAMVKLTREQQEMLCEAEPSILAPVPGGWGLRGATHIRLAPVDAATLASALAMAFRNVAPPSLRARLGGPSTAGRGISADAPPPSARPKRRKPRIRKARRTEAEAISQVIVRAIEETNARDYAPHVVEVLKQSFATAEVERRMRERLQYVAVIGNELVGTASLAKGDARLHSVFVDPARQGEGIGVALVTFIEELARRRGHARLSLTSSLTAVPFYRRLGYRGSRREARGGIVETVWMSKRLARDCE